MPRPHPPLLLALSLSFLCPRAQASPQGGPTGDTRGSALSANLDRALAILDASVAAHGGTPWVRGDVGYRIEFTGTYFVQAHLARPWAHHEFSVEGSLELAPEWDVLRREAFMTRGHVVQTLCALNGSAGVRCEFGGAVGTALSPEEVQQAWLQEREWMPQEFLRQALEEAASLTSLGQSGRYDIVQYQRPGEPRRALLIGRESHLLERVETIVHHPSKGDRLQWREFGAYETVKDVQVPGSIQVHVEEPTVQKDWDLHVVNPAVGAERHEGDFVLPEPHRAAFPGLHRQRFAPRAPAPLPVETLGPGVYALSLEAVNGRCLVIEFDDHCAVWESGGTSDVAEQILRTAAALCPGKPVRYLLMSHHHRISASGLRPYVQRGVTLVATKGNETYLRDLAARPYRLAPDAQAADPKQPKFKFVEGQLILEDPAQHVELHAFDASTHTDEYLLTYFPKLRMLSVGDLVYLPPGPAGRPAGRPTGRRSEALLTGIRELALDAEVILQAFPLDPRYLRIPVPK